MVRITSLMSVAATLGLASVLAAPLLAAGGSSILGKNLVTNGDAESGPGAASDVKVSSIPDWTVSGGFDVIQYGASGGFPDANSPGPTDRGKNFFYGGPGSTRSTAVQSISLSAAKTDISAGTIDYTFSAYLGGFGNQTDNAILTADFKGASGSVLKHVVLGPVTPADRNNVTGLVARSTTGIVPTGSRSVSLKLVLTRYDGGDNDGSADNISLILNKK